jgi:ComF family protein
LCPGCLARLPRLLPPLCPGCSRPQASGIICPTCRQRKTDLDGIRSPYRFEGVIRKAIHQLKYQNLRAISACLAQLLADYHIAAPLPGDALVSVPLHPKRLRERGYNQSSLLARELSRRIDLPVTEDCLIRVRQAQPQVRASDVDQRRSNVADAFACRGEKLIDRRIILIDDVCTSGATLDSCATALKRSGAASVWALTLAREIHN